MPDGWKPVTFGEMADNITDRVDKPAEAGVDRYVGLEHLDSESLTIRHWGAPTDVASTKLRFRSGDIIFGKRRAYQRKLAVADFDGICSAHAMVLRAKHDAILSSYLPYFMQTDEFMERAIRISVGSLSPTINWKALATEVFVVPPLDHQRKIVDASREIDDIEEGLIAARRALGAARDKLVERFVRTHSSPEQETTIGDLCERVTDGTHQPPPFTTKGVPFFLVKTISGGAVNWSHTKFVSETTYESLTKRVAPKKGDVLFTAVGATYGVALCVDFDGPFTFQRHIAHLIPDPHRVDGRYLAMFLNSPAGRRQSDAAAVGSAQPTVTLASLASFRIPRVSLAQQAALVRRDLKVLMSLSAIDARREALLRLRRRLHGRDL